VRYSPLVSPQLPPRRVGVRYREAGLAVDQMLSDQLQPPELRAAVRRVLESWFAVATIC